MANKSRKEERRERLRNLTPEMMMVLIFILEVIAVIVLIQVLFTKPAHAADGEPWKNWGAAPFATSREAACRKVPEAIDGFIMPSAVKNHFKQVLGAACNGGDEVWLTPGMALEQMWSGSDARHKVAYLMNKKPVAYLSVLKSPDGRTYPKDSVGETARVLSWTFVYDGKIYSLYLPHVCFNWSWSFMPIPKEPCATVKYTVDPGDVVVFAFLERSLMPASSCLQLCDGGACSSLPAPCYDCSWLDTLSVLPAGLKPLQTGMYIAKSAKQSLRLPKEATADTYVGIAVTREGLGQSDAWVVTPLAWMHDADTLGVPYGGQQWPAWGEVDMSKWRK